MSTPQEMFPATELTVRGQKTRFPDLAQLTAFWQRERDAFRPLYESSRATRTNPSAQFLQHMVQRQNGVDAQFNELNQIFRRVTSTLTDAQRAELQGRVNRQADQVMASLQTVFADDAHGSWLTTESEGQFLLELKKANRDEAAFAMLYLKGADFSDDTFAAHSGAIKAHLFRTNLSGARGDAEAAALAAITANWRAEAEKMINEMTQHRETAAKLNQAHVTALEEQAAAAQQQENQFKEFLAIRDNDVAAQLVTSKSELEKLASTYDQHMKLQAPVAYWSEKKGRHQEESARRKFWVVFMGTALFGFLSLYVWLNFHEKAGIVPWREIVGFFVLSSMAFWVMKVLVRLFLSAIHLAEDAAEREVMAMTYMALVRGDETKTRYLDEKDRALVLAPLFRPSSTGVMDDGAPPHVSEIITKLGR